MRFKTEIREGVAVVRLSGRFVIGSDSDFLCVRKHLEETGTVKAIVDLREVPYIDSTGLAFVVDLHKALKARGGKVMLTNANPRVREVLALTRICEVVPLAADLDSAEAMLRGQELAASC